jgi:Domain of unknown function (DUF5658)
MDSIRFGSVGCLLYLLAVPLGAQAQVVNPTQPVLLEIPAEAAEPAVAAVAPPVRETAAARQAARIPVTFVLQEEPSRRPAALVPMYSGMIALQGYDAYSTLAAIKRGAVETNPVASATVTQPAAFLAMKGVAAAATVYSAERLWRKGRRKSAVALMIVTNGALAVVTARNASVLRSVR